MLHQSFSKPPSKTLTIPGKEFVQVRAKGVPTTSRRLQNPEFMQEQQQELLTDSCISQSWHIELSVAYIAGSFKIPAVPYRFGNGALDSLVILVCFFRSNFNFVVWNLFSGRGIQLYENLEVDEETKFSAVVRAVDDSGYDDCEDILFDSRNDETFKGISGATGKSSTDMNRRKMDDVAQDEVQFSQLSTNLRDVCQTYYDDHSKQLSADVVPKGSSILNRGLEGLFSEHTGASVNKEDTRNQMIAEEAQMSVSQMSVLEGAASTSADNSLLRTSSVSSFSSGKSTLSPHAKEFKLNPNAKSFIPSQSSLRPASPASVNSFYYPAGLLIMYLMQIGPSFSASACSIHPQARPVPQPFFHPNRPQIGPSFSAHQPVLFNPQARPVPQPSFHQMDHRQQTDWSPSARCLYAGCNLNAVQEESTNQLANHIA
ncbi:Polyadenylate-binding protein-interacting protein 3 [Datura stramonium]|uniref:Polyadenylate-binding protein-interacting protein 3 n=1 Tax=Datura stramonium TaxID=4076 RepID=A0ABS8RT76_DATST|nr:Polyadenylate-binding protein-interacting protein 3 [Datura stramonium]